jgi:hypothetical protein
MTPAELVVRYRGLAAKCLLLALSQQRDTEKLALIDALIAVANAWVALAEHAEKNESLFDREVARTRFES